MPYTLLLADDSVTIQRVIELTFTDEDVTVIAVGDGDQAIERLEAAPPDIVLADIGMPGKNGYEVAQYIRQSPRLAHIPVLLLTGAFEPVDQVRASEVGCDGVLAKPFEPQQVISRVKELLARAPRPAGFSTPTIQPAEAMVATVPAPASAPAAKPDPYGTWAALAEQGPGASAFGQVTAESTSTSTPASELSDYFDRLDAAFSTLSSSVPSPPQSKVASSESPETGLETDIDWFGSKAEETGAGEPWDLPAPPSDGSSFDWPVTYGSPQPETVPSAPEPESFAAVTALEPTFVSSPVEAEEPPQAVPIAEAAPAPAAEAAPAVGPAPIAESILEAEAPPVEAEPTIEAEPMVEAAPTAEVTPTLEVAPIIEAVPRLDAAPTVEPAPVVESASIDPPDERLAPIEESTPIQPAAVVAEPAVPDPPAAAAPTALQIPLPNPPPLPTLPDAFAALLAAEQGEPLSPDTGLWPIAAGTPPPPPAAVSEELLDEVTRRVLDRLSDTVVRDAVADIASKIAERLVREEIERIRASIK